MFFSVYIPVKNRPEMLLETLEAIKNQTFQDFECWIGDDGSTDNTLQVIKDFCTKDRRFHYVTHPISRGDPVMSNHLLSVLQGQYGARMDSDDIPKKDWLKASFDFIQKNPSIVAFGSQVEYFGIMDLEKSIEDKKREKPQELAIYSMFNYEIAHSGFIFNRDIQRKNGLFYKDYTINNDWDFMMSFSQFGDLSNLDTAQVMVRRHKGNTSNPRVVVEDMNALSVQLRKKIIQKHLKFEPSEFEMAIHCCCFPAPYWKFEEQALVNQLKEGFLTELEQWFTKIENSSHDFPKYLLEKILDDIYQENVKRIESIDNWNVPIKMQWLPEKTQRRNTCLK